MYPTLAESIFRATWRFFPLKLVEFVKYLPRREYSRFRKTRKVIDAMAGSLVDQAVGEAKQVEIEKRKKDVMSVLGKSYLIVMVHGMALIKVPQYVPICPKTRLYGFQRRR